MCDAMDCCCCSAVVVRDHCSRLAFTWLQVMKSTVEGRGIGAFHAATARVQISVSTPQGALIISKSRPDIDRISVRQQIESFGILNKSLLHFSSIEAL